jgi:Transglutaminase-like superfamily
VTIPLAAAPELTRPFTAAEKASLALEILSSYLRARWLLRRSGLAPTVNTLRRAAPRPNPATATATEHDQLVGLRLGRVLERTLRVIPFDSRCLVRSLVLTHLLARRGIPSSLIIGIGSGRTFAAHAWVESDGKPLLRPGEFADRRLLEL